MACTARSLKTPSKNPSNLRKLRFVRELKKIKVNRVLSWDDAEKLAKEYSGRLPTRQELDDDNVNNPAKIYNRSRDFWHPVSRTDGRKYDWAQIGVHSNKQKCKELSKKLDKTIVLSGSATDEDLLKSENISNIDIFCALTDDDETNLMSSLIAKKMGAKKTMIILNNPSYLGLVPGFIDIYIAPYRLTVSSVLQDLRESDVTQDVLLKMDTGAEAIEGVVHANEFTSNLFGKSVKEIPLPEGASIGAVVRHGDLIMPDSNVELCLNDHLIIFLANKDMVSEVEILFKTQ